MKSINFEFLQPHDEGLAFIGALAEKSLYFDPSNTLAKSRIFAEKAVDLIFDMYALPALPTGSSLIDRLNEDSFKEAVPPTILDKLHTIRIKGNKGAHDVSAQTTTAVHVLQETHDLARWMFVMFWNGKSEDCQPFTIPSNPQIRAAERLQIEKQMRQQIAAQEAELQILLEKLEAAQTNKQSTERSPEDLQEIAAAGFRASDALQFNEEETRLRLIDALLLAAGWNVGERGESTETVGQEVYLKKTKEKIDYALYGDDGKPLAVIEAKRTAKSVESGRTQAKLYADQLEADTGQRPVIFYSNGFETYLWNDAVGETPRKVFGFYSKDSLEYLIFQRKNRLPPTEVQPDSNIAGRIYQIEAIKRVAERFNSGRRKALLVQATGTGKTRVAVSLSELLYRARWAKRILFLCDRRELRKQADGVFKDFLPGEPRTIVSAATADDRDKRIYLATYPAMMQCFESFDVGFFDLIIADESHRSIYNRYRDLFLYFDCPQIGLTATPVGHINRNTYSLFDCEDGDPTANFGYEEAINSNPAYLVPFEVFDVTTDFMRRGIKYTQLNEEQREQLEESEEDAHSFDYEVEQVNKLVFNRPTNEFILRHLMEQGLREKNDQHVGKSIVFARNHNHAVFLQKVFDELFPQYGGGFCRVIDSHDPRADELITEFKKPDSKLTIAISVDMLDTGIDIPEVVNLVFAKPVKSYVKFWQMIGRGTRLREGLFGLGKNKTKFYIFDHCGNFDFFEHRYQAAEPAVTKSLLQRLFEARIELAQAAINAQDAETFDQTIELIAQDIAALPNNSISVKEKWRSVLEIQQEGVLSNFAPQTVNLLQREIAPLMQWRNIEGLEKQYEFDLLLTRLQAEKLKKTASFADRRDEVRTAISFLPINLNAVRDKLELIQQAKNIQFWETVGLEEIERIRIELRGLMRLALEIVLPGLQPREIDVEEDATKIYSRRIAPKLEGLQLVNYKRRVQEILEKLIDESPALQKIKNGQTIAGKDFDELCALVLAQDPELNLRDLETHFPDLADNLDIAIRSIIGLNAPVVEMRFEDFVQRHNLSSKQIRFLSLVKNHLTKYGVIEIDRLYESPFTDVDTNGLDGVFTNKIQADELLEILAKLNEPKTSDTLN